MDTDRAPQCPMCRSTRTVDYCSGAGDFRRNIPWRFHFFLCRLCRLRFQIPVSDPQKLFEVQDQAQVKRPMRRRELRCDRDVLRSVAKSVSGRRLLEIGPGDGRFLESARRAGWDCTGVEVSERVAECARSRSGINILVGDLRQFRLPDGFFDVVNIDQVLVYVEDPTALLVEVQRVLKPDGVCRIREYDSDSLSALLAGTEYWMYCPTFLLVWSYKSIRTVAEATRMKITHIFPGTEASLGSWLDTELDRTVLNVFRCAVKFALRKLAFLGWSVAADKVYYLRRSAT